MDAFLEPVRRDLLGAAVGFHPLGQRAAAAEHLVEAGVCGAVTLWVAAADLHVEVVAHLLDEADGLAGELAPGAGQRPQVRADEVGALVGEAVGAGYQRQIGEQPLAWRDQIGRFGVRLVGHQAAQLPGLR